MGKYVLAIITWCMITKSRIWLQMNNDIKLIRTGRIVIDLSGASIVMGKNQNEIIYTFLLLCVSYCYWFKPNRTWTCCQITEIGTGAGKILPHQTVALLWDVRTLTKLVYTCDFWLNILFVCVVALFALVHLLVAFYALNRSFLALCADGDDFVFHLCNGIASANVCVYTAFHRYINNTFVFEESSCH